MILLELTKDLLDSNKNKKYAKHLNPIIRKYSSEDLFQEFLKEQYNEGKDLVTNTDPDTKKTYPKVTVNTLLGKDKNYKATLDKEFEIWKGSKEKETSAKEKNLSILEIKDDKELNLDPNDFSVSFLNKKAQEKFKKWGIKANAEEIVRLCGGTSAGGRIGLSARMTPKNGIEVVVSGPNLSHNKYFINVDEKNQPYIKLDSIEVTKKAPKGTGTRAFVSAILQAQKLGIKKLKLLGYRETSGRDKDRWVGYDVWFKLGCDGPIPLTKEHAPVGETCPPLPENIEKQFKEKGYKEPYTVAQLQTVEGGSEWWKKNGVTYEGTFDISKDSPSMKVLSHYLDKRSKLDNLSVEEWFDKKG